MKQLLTHRRAHSFKACRQRHYFEYEMGLRPETDARALRIYEAGLAGLNSLKQGDSLAEALLASSTRYDLRPCEIDCREWEYERETIACLIAGYHWHWGQALDLVAPPTAFRFPLRNPQTGAASTLWDRAGRLDGIVRDSSGKLFVLKHRFTSEDLSPESFYWSRLQLDHRACGEMSASRQLEHSVSGVLFDVIRKPTIKPTSVAMLDDNGQKIVVDRVGHRVFNTNGEPRQTANVVRGYTLQTRPMTPLEWGKKLLEDIGHRPDFYFARREAIGNEEHLAEMQTEAWELQKTIRAAQRNGRWFKTIGRETCPACPFFELCSSQYQPDGGVPEGFVRLKNVHPELESPPYQSAASTKSKASSIPAEEIPF